MLDPRDPNNKLLNYRTKVVGAEGEIGEVSLYLGSSPLFQQLTA
jgi:hypothetical protein